MRVVDKASQHGHESPGNQNACNPDPAAELVQEQVAGNFKKEIAQKEDPGDQTELLAGNRQLLVHRQRRKPNVDPVEKADDVQQEKKGQYPLELPPRSLPSARATVLLGLLRVNAQDTPVESNPDLPLEIAHLLLIDVVGYSKLLVNEQIELLQELNQIVRNTEGFRSAEASGKLNRVPMGDGMALLFFHSPEEPVRCALEISRTLQEHPHIQVRMGVHSGPVNRVTDVNDKM